MVFEFLRFFVKIALKFYFRTIYFLDEHNIPDNQPVIVASNHSNSAMDAIIIDAFLQKNKLYWLARGDVFSNKWIAKFMTSVRTAPIYRSSEAGFVEIKRNNNSFKICFDLLNKNLMVGIFPEGITVPKRKLQVPFKKGFARLAFQAQEALGRPVMILPVGVSYQSLTETNTDVFVKFGQAFSSDLFYKDYVESQSLGLKNITLHLEHQLNECIINYDNVENQAALNQEIFIKNNQLVKGKSRNYGLVNDSRFYDADLKIVNDFIKKEKLETPKNFPLKSENTIEVNSKNSFENNNSFKYYFYNIFIFWGKFIYFIPNQLSKYIVNSKIKYPAFWGTVRFVLLYFMFPIFTFLMAILAGFYANMLFWAVLFGFPLVVGLGLRCEKLISK